MEVLRWVVSPLTAVFRFLLETIHSLVGSYGLSIIILSLVVAVILYPIARRAQALEMVNRQRHEAMAPEISEAKKLGTGRERFERIEDIYKRYNYHPIKSMASLLPLFLQLPFLLAALFLLVDYPPLKGVPFLFIPDLSVQDALISLPGSWSLNLIPITMALVALLDSQLKPEGTTETRIRYLIVLGVICILIYKFPAGVCLYWLCSNVWSLARTLYRRRSAS